MHREKKREIGDDSNKIRDFEPMTGRISALAFDATGKRFAAAASLDGKGEVWVYDTESGKQAVRCEEISGPAYTVAWAPNGSWIASSGFDGVVWVNDATTGKLVTTFGVVPKVTSPRNRNDTLIRTMCASARSPPALAVRRRRAPPRSGGDEAHRSPAEARTAGPHAYTQLVVTAQLNDGSTMDVTRAVELPPCKVATVSKTGLVRPLVDGDGELEITFGTKLTHPGHHVGGQSRAAHQLRLRRSTRPVQARLQRRHVPRGRAGQERLQALAPRLRPASSTTGP